MLKPFGPGSVVQWTPDTNPQPVKAMLLKFLPSDDCVAVIVLETGEVTVSRVGNLWLPEEATQTCQVDCDGSACDGL